jgi:hypothetical protein
MDEISLSGSEEEVEQMEVLEQASARPAWLEGLESDHEWLSKTVKVWFSDKKKYFIGSIWDYEGDDSFSIMWGNHHKEIVPLVKDHLYLDCTSDDALHDNDRWSFVV